MRKSFTEDMGTTTTDRIGLIKSHASRLRLTNLPNRLEQTLLQAQQDKPGYAEFLLDILQKEIEVKREKDFMRRLKAANLPARHDLDLFDPNYSAGLPQPRLNELRELTWLAQAYNLILMGPSGTGKTFIAAGLVHQAVCQGLRAYMLTMEDLMGIIRMKDLSPSAMTAYNKLLRAHLVAIDDIMLYPLTTQDATGIFNLNNTLHEKTSVIITTNKAPTEWAATLDDEVIATALLDRLLYRCEVVKLSGESYRLKNRKTIFNTQNQ